MTETTPTDEERGNEDLTPRHYLTYSLFKVDPAWRRLDAQTHKAHTEEFAELVERWDEDIVIRTYTMVGTRADTELLIWRASPDLGLIQQSQAELNATGFGSYLLPTHNYLATTKPSQYLKDVKREGFTKPRPLDVVPIDADYLIMYPFVKQRSWYRLDAKERGMMMREHAQIGRKYPEIKLNTAYSFGLDDQEFVVAFETDNPHRFLDLMMELRSSDASAYTERDVPIFTCRRLGARECVVSLGAKHAAGERIFGEPATVRA